MILKNLRQIKKGVFLLYYELYIDSLFLINFVMNLYLLALVNRSLLRTASGTRLLVGAGIGAVAYLVPFFLPGIAAVKMVAGFLIGAGLMLKVTFRLKTFRTFLRAGEWLLLDTFLLGGGILFLLRLFPRLRAELVNIFGVMGLGMLLFLLLSYHKARKNKQNSFCKVTLKNEEKKVAVEALVDTGNGLMEPISGKPVSIMEPNILENLWQDGLPELYRAIPYHSVGKKRGILRGYLVPEALIEVEGVTKICRDVCIGVSEEKIASEGGYQMLLNPQLLEI
jgi:stage II sporulation protein GA (sporulation sigma-E factor processing peptidase)